MLTPYALECDGTRIPISMPEPGGACEHHGGEWSFGLAAVDRDVAAGWAGRTARLFTGEGIPLGELQVVHVDMELCVGSADPAPARDAALP